MGDPARLEPGSMITVQLVSGDLSVGADGTVTHVDGNKIYAFGHRFLSRAIVFIRRASSVVDISRVTGETFPRSAQGLFPRL